MKILGIEKIAIYGADAISENDNIFLLWDCFWSPIKNDSNRDIKKVN